MTEELLERMLLRLPGERNEELLTELLVSAGEIICAYTARRTVPEILSGAQVDLALVLYNRMGTEGERSRTEGSIRIETEGLPELLRKQLLPYRLARTVSSCG